MFSSTKFRLLASIMLEQLNSTPEDLDLIWVTNFSNVPFVKSPGPFSINLFISSINRSISPLPCSFVSLTIPPVYLFINASVSEDNAPANGLAAFSFNCRTKPCLSFMSELAKWWSSFVISRDIPRLSALWTSPWPMTKERIGSDTSEYTFVDNAAIDSTSPISNAPAPI